MTAQSAAARYVAVGGLCGLTWAASLRGWMVQLAEGDTSSSVTWLTFWLLLLPGLATGVLRVCCVQRAGAGLGSGEAQVT